MIRITALNSDFYITLSAHRLDLFTNYTGGSLSCRTCEIMFCYIEQSVQFDPLMAVFKNRRTCLVFAYYVEYRVYFGMCVLMGVKYRSSMQSCRSLQ